MTEQEQQLWENYWQGKSSQAENELVKRYHKMVFATFNKHWYNMRDHEHDFISHGMEGLLKAVRVWRGEGRISNFLQTCIMDAMINCYRHITRKTRLPISYGVGVEGFPIPDEIDMEDVHEKLRNIFQYDYDTDYDIMLQKHGEGKPPREMMKNPEVKKRWTTKASFVNNSSRILSQLRQRASDLGMC